MPPVVEVPVMESSMERESFYADLVEKLEHFFLSPELMVRVGDFMGEHVQSLIATPKGDEQPLINHDVFNKYSALIEDVLEAFLSEHDAEGSDLYEAVLMSKENGNDSICCLDFLLASVRSDDVAAPPHSLLPSKVQAH